MKGYHANTYGDRWADIYDSWAEQRFSEEMTEAAVSALHNLAGSRRVLELGIGTGRVAVPLAQRGVDVLGIDASEAMVAKLRAKPGGDAVGVTIADFAEFDVEGEFGLIFIAFNTFFALATQERQLSCLHSVAKHLDDAGVFVVEGFVPDLGRFDADQTVRALRMGADEVHLEASLHDPVAQTVQSQHIALTDHGIQMRPTLLRYVWPSELDLMARLAGLRLRERWGGWDRSDFDAGSTGHVSVYGRAP